MNVNLAPDGLIARLERLPFSSWHWKLAIIAGLGVLFDATDFALFGAALPPIAKEFGLNPAQSGLLATTGLVGAALGAILCGTVSDYIGRKTTFIATMVVFAIFTGLTALSWDVNSLAAFRFLANLGLGGLIPVSSTLVSEFMPSRIRGRASTWVQSAFPVGLALAAGLGLLIIGPWGWRALFLVGLLPLVLVYFAYRYLRESVRFLISKGRVVEAETIVGGIECEALGQASVVPSGALAGVHADTGAAHGITVAELLDSRYRRRTILLWIVSFCFFWSANGLLFMLPTILTLRGVPLSQAISFALVQGVFGLFGYVACGYLIDRFGRRPVLALYYLIGAAFHLWFAEASGLWMYVAIAGVGWVNPGVFGPTGVYAGELYPTHIRATAVGWYFGIGRIGSFLAPVVVGLLLAHGLGHYVLHTFALTYLIAAAAVFAIGIETRGVSLEQVQAGAAA